MLKELGAGQPPSIKSKIPQLPFSVASLHFFLSAKWKRLPRWKHWRTPLVKTRSSSINLSRRLIRDAAAFSSSSRRAGIAYARLLHISAYLAIGGCHHQRPPIGTSFAVRFVGSLVAVSDTCSCSELSTPGWAFDNKRCQLHDELSSIRWMLPMSLPRHAVSYVDLNAAAAAPRSVDRTGMQIYAEPEFSIFSPGIFHCVSYMAMGPTASPISWDVRQ